MCSRKRDCEAVKEWQWVPRAGTSKLLSLGSEISKPNVVVIVLANLNHDMATFRPPIDNYQHASIYHINAMFSFLEGLR